MAFRPRILIIAEAANPEWVSVPLVGWSIASALRGVADVHIVTQIRNRAAMLRAGLIEGVDFTAIDSEAVARPAVRFAKALRMGWTAGQAIGALTYPYFEHLVWKAFGARIAAGEFDLVHRVTPLSPTCSSLIARKCRRAGTPFVLGPLNGGVPWPAGFDAERRREREWLSYVRGVYKLLPGRRATLEAASAILVGSRHTMSEIPAAQQPICFYIPENGIDPTRFSRIAAHDTDGPLRACFIGRLVPYKGPDMLIEAAAPLLRDGRMTLDIVGDGPMMADLRAQVEKEGVADAVRLLGWIAHKEVQTILAEADLLAFPSIREFGGGVVLEAMAIGVAPLVIDYAGPGELVTEGLGVKVPIGTRAEIIAAFRDALIALATDPAELVAMGARGRAHVAAKFTWARKAEQVLEVYAWVLGQRDTKPELF
jgi:glycosyltransferase involved in cell wall biosynthesis